MITTAKVPSKGLIALACCAALSSPSLDAANVYQTANIPGGGSNNPIGGNWNESAYWQSPVAAGNAYYTVPGFANSATEFTINGIPWSQTSHIRDASTNPNIKRQNAAFLGDSLHLVSNTMFLSKVENGFSTTANIVFDGGFIRHAGDSTANGTSVLLAGTISFGSSNIGAIGSHNGGNFVLNIASTIIGGADDTLQLTTTVLGSNRINLLGDMSGFFGTIYAGGNQTGSWGSNTSNYSVQSDAVNATIHLDTFSSGFRYHMVGDVTFGRLLLGGEFEVAPGTYGFEDLNELSGTPFFSGDGLITVVPEPSVLALAMMGGLGVLLVKRLRQRHFPV